MPLINGQSATQLQSAANAEAALPEQTQVQLNINLRTRTGVNSLASAINWAAGKYGLQPWDAATPIAAADPSNPVLYVRWTKAKVGMPLIIAILAGGMTALAALGALGVIEIPDFIIAALFVVALLLIVGWEFYRNVVAPAISAAKKYWPYLLGGVVGVGGVALLVSAARRRPPSDQTE